MIEKNISIQTNHGSMDTFMVYPDENNSYPLVVFLMDAPGKRQELHDMAVGSSNNLVPYLINTLPISTRVAPGFVHSNFRKK